MQLSRIDHVHFFAQTAVPRLKRYAVACLRLTCIVVLIGATCMQMSFLFSLTARRGLILKRTTLLFAILGVRVEIDGLRRALHCPALFVSNHISWLDALAIQQHFNCSFVVKSEVFRWPIVGRLCRAAQGISIERGSAFGLVSTLSEINTALEKRQSVGVFPEATTSFGDSVLPFSNGIFEAAIFAGVPIQPLLVYYRNSDCSQSYAFVSHDSFLGSLWRVCLTPNTVMSIRCLQVLAPFGSRKTLCAEAYALIVAAHRRHKTVMNEWHDTGTDN